MDGNITPALIALITASVVGGAKMLEVAAATIMRRKNGTRDVSAGVSVELSKIDSKMEKLQDSFNEDRTETAAALAGLKQQVVSLEGRVDRIAR